MDLRLPNPRRRGGALTWLSVALAGVVLGAAALGCALTIDSRDYTARHTASFGIRAL